MVSNNRRRWMLTVLAASLMMLASTACSSMRGSGPPPAAGFATPVPAATAYWWAYRFQIDWPADEPADMAIDLLLAHAVVKPALAQFAPRLIYWRFHRRAARDQTGHQFSFLFYGDRQTAEELYTALDASPVLPRVREQGLVTRIVKNDPRHPNRPGIADTSDPHWSPMLQRQWPAYIMGVSIMWLGLIDEAVAELPAALREGDDRLAAYRQAEARVSRLWYEEGQHALLHHLSAVFGYRELLVVNPMRF